MSILDRDEQEEKIARTYHDFSTMNSTEDASRFTPMDEVIAGEDDRRDLFNLGGLNVEASVLQSLANSTVILTNKINIVEQQDGSYKLAVAPFRRSGLSACGGERFGNQHTGGWCSGFVVGSDIIVTAGHCGETEDDIKATAYIFGFKVSSETDPGTTVFVADQVYFGKELIAHELSDRGDFAIVRVDRKIVAEGAAPRKIRRQGSLGVGENVGVIGHPSGLPAKVAFGPTTVIMKDSDPWLLANLDTYGGNSGSGVFGIDGTVEGILVRGVRDYEIDSENRCFRSNRIVNSEGSEAITKASVFVDLIPGTND